MNRRENTQQPVDTQGTDDAVNPKRFWRFSLALYRRSNIPEACLELQDSFGCDVNMALFCLWTGLRSGQISDDTMQNAVKLSEEWGRRAVRPLRAVRRDLKSGMDGVAWQTVREQIKAVELAAEQAQQQALEALAAQDSSSGRRLGRGEAETAFNRYATLAGLAVQAETKAFQTLLTGAERVDDGDRRA